MSEGGRINRTLYAHEGREAGAGRGTGPDDTARNLSPSRPDIKKGKFPSPTVSDGADEAFAPSCRAGH